jgi:hypothetical protein
MSLVLDVAASNPIQRLHCVDLLRTSYATVQEALTEEGMAGEAARVKSDILEAVVQLLLTNDSDVVLAIMEWLSGVSKEGSTDTTVIRHFLKAMLSKVAAPYSAAFVEFVAGLFLFCIPENDNFSYVRQLTRVFEVPGGPSIVEQFLEQAASTNNLSPKAATALAAIRFRITPKEKRPKEPEKRPEVVKKSATVIKIANLNPELIKQKQAEAAALAAVTAAAAKASKRQKKKKSSRVEEEPREEPKKKKSKAAATKPKKEEKKTKKKKTTSSRPKRSRPDAEVFADDSDGDFDSFGSEDFVEKKRTVAPRKRLARTVKKTQKLGVVIPSELLPKKEGAPQNNHDEECFLEFSDD